MTARRQLVAGAIATALAVSSTALASPASAAPAPRPVKITDARVLANAGDPGVLEVGDSFRIVFDQRIMAYAPDLAVRATDATGDSVYLSDNGSEISYTIEDLVVTRKVHRKHPKHGKHHRHHRAIKRTRVLPDRVLVVTIRDAYDYLPQLDLPLTLRGVDGIYYAGNYDEAAAVDVAGSTDSLVDVE